MSSFEGRFDFSELKKDLESERNRIRRVIRGLLVGSGNSTISFGPIKIDLIVEFEKRLASVSDARLHAMVEELKKEFD